MAAAEARFWVDGIEGASIPPDDRGLNYADGAFETLDCRDGRICCRTLHLDRLTESLKVLRFETPGPLAESAFKELDALVDTQHHDGSARLTITRGSGPRGYAPIESVPRRIVALYPRGAPASESVRCMVADTRWAEQPLFAGSKALARAEQVLAAAEAMSAGVDDALMMDLDGRVISSSRGNIFLLLGETVVTPSLERCGIKGTRRRLLLDSVFPGLGVPVDIRAVTQTDIEQSDQIMICNALQGLVWVSQMGNRQWSKSPLYERFRYALLREAQR